MKDSIHPNDNASTEAAQALEDASLVEGVVDAVFVDSETVRVRISQQNHELCDVLTTSGGDTLYPSVGETAVFARRTTGRPLLLGTFGEAAEIEEGERIIGHSGSDTHLRLNNDGTIDIIPDGATSAVLTVSSNGLEFTDMQVMTDVSTTTDADGHVTSVDPIYTTTISL